MQLINLTPHPINIYSEQNGSPVVKLQPDGTVARVTATKTVMGITPEGVKLHSVQYSEVTGLPKATVGVGYVVSQMVRIAVPHRADVYSPGEPVRDSAGFMVGCVGLDTNL